MNGRELESKQITQSEQDALTSGLPELRSYYKPVEELLPDLFKNRPVAKGKFGEIYKTFLNPKDSTHPVAVKTIKNSLFLEILQELDVLFTLSSIPHPNINAFKGFTCKRKDTQVAFIFDWVDAGSLTQQPPQSHETIGCVEAVFFIGKSDYNFVSFMAAVATGVAHLHQHNIIHKDIAPKNILVEKVGDGYIPKLCDFGLSFSLGHEIRDRIEGRPWHAPECVENKNNWSKASDVWDFGTLMMNIKRLIEDNECSYKHYDYNNIESIVTGQACPVIDDDPISPWLPDLVSSCFAFKPEDRPSMHEIAAYLNLMVIFKDNFFNHSNYTNDQKKIQDTTNNLVSIVAGYVGVDSVSNNYDSTEFKPKMTSPLRQGMISYDSITSLGFEKFYPVTQSTIYKAELKEKSKSFSVLCKKYDPDFRGSGSYFVSRFLQELDVFLNFTKFPHPNIVRCYGFFIDALVPKIIDAVEVEQQQKDIITQRYPFLVSEWDSYEEKEYMTLDISLTRDNMKQYLSNPHYFLKFIAGIADAVQHIHKYHIIHRGIHSTNITVAQGMVPKIANFSHAFFNNKNKNFSDNNTFWRASAAPECLLHNPEWVQASDVWEFAMLILEIKSLQQGKPFYPYGSPTIDWDQMLKGKLLPSIPENLLPSWLHSLVKQCLEIKPDMRPSMETVSNILNEKLAVSDVVDELVNKVELSHSTKPFNRL